MSSNSSTDSGEKNRRTIPMAMKGVSPMKALLKMKKKEAMMAMRKAKREQILQGNDDPSISNDDDSGASSYLPKSYRVDSENPASPTNQLLTDAKDKQKVKRRNVSGAGSPGGKSEGSGKDSDYDQLLDTLMDEVMEKNKAQTQSKQKSYDQIRTKKGEEKQNDRSLGGSSANSGAAITSLARPVKSSAAEPKASTTSKTDKGAEPASPTKRKKRSSRFRKIVRPPSPKSAPPSTPPRIIPKPQSGNDFSSVNSTPQTSNTHNNNNNNSKSDKNALNTSMESKENTYSEPTKKKYQTQSILRSSSRSDDVSVVSTSSVGTNDTGRKTVSFADAHGSKLHNTHTLTVSPSKLTRRVRRKSASSDIPEDMHAEEEKIQKGVMGRVLVLLMDPPTKQYELTSLPYPLVSTNKGIVGPTQLKVLLALVSKSASYEPLKEKQYKGFCRPADSDEDIDKSVELKNDLTILDHRFVKDEVLIAIPKGYSAKDCLKFSKPILQDKRLVRLLKKLKKHEKKVERKRKLKEQIEAVGTPERVVPPFNPTAYSPVRVKTTEDEGVDNPMSWEKYFRNEKLRRQAWFVSIAILVLVALLVMMKASTFERNKMHEIMECLSRTSMSHVNAQPYVGGNVRFVGDESNYPVSAPRRHERSSAGKQHVCGRGILCKPIPPFGIQNNERPRKAFASKVLDEISRWKLEGDDFMI